MSRLLRNPVYIGAVNWHGQLPCGEQEAIVDSALWQQVNAWLGPRTNGRHRRRERLEALLRGLLYCEPCQSPMVPTCTRKNHRQYRYYVCLEAQKQGWASCPSKSLPAHRIEEAVWQQIRERGLAAEQSAGRQALEALVERIDFDGRSGRVTIRLRPAEAEGSR